MVFAYLDPAAGGMIIQSIIAAAVAVPFLLRTHITRAIGRLKGHRQAEKPDGPSSSAE